MERLFEQLLYRSRWLLAPIYFGLSLAVVALGVKFFLELVHLFTDVMTITEADLVLIVLSLIDLAMVGGLLVMVMMSGYENFVSRLDLDESDEKLSWLGKMDATSLKTKIAAAIVAISSIHLLKQFMKLETVEVDHLKWYVLIHLTFVGSAFAMGYLDVLSRKKIAANSK